MRILVISNTPWGNNSFGLSYSNIFSGIPGLQFANIFLNYGKPDNCFDMRYYQITPRALIRNIIHPSKPTGMIVTQDTSVERDKNETLSFETARKLRWQILYWAKDFLWKIGRWKSNDFLNFLDEFNPDVIFQPIYYSTYINEIACFVQNHLDIPMLGYISDDCYTLKQFSLSPFYWIDRLIKRRKVKNTIEHCKILYVISQIQKEEYGAIFPIPCKVLTKCADFSIEKTLWSVPSGKISLLFAGNIGDGRWRSLGLIANTIELLNQEGFSLEMHIFSSTAFTSSMKRALNRSEVHLHDSVPYSKIQMLQNEADVLVHVEGLSLKDRLTVHQSFSTKLVDYFALGKCIFAVGTRDEASISHLLKYNAALVACNEKEIEEKLRLLVLKPEIVTTYGINAFLCGQNSHNRESMQTMIMDDLQNTITSDRLIADQDSID